MGTDVNAVGPGGTALYIASEQGHSEVCFFSNNPHRKCSFRKDSVLLLRFVQRSRGGFERFNLLFLINS